MVQLSKPGICYLPEAHLYPMCPIAAPHMHCCPPGVPDSTWDKVHHYGFCSATPCPTGLSSTLIPSCTSGLLVSTDPGLCFVLNYNDYVPWDLRSTGGAVPLIMSPLLLHHPLIILPFLGRA